MTLRQAQSYTKPYRNLALFPASLLPYKSQWQEIANGLSHNGVLIILPDTRHHLRKTLETVTALLKSHGHPVTTLPAERFANLVKLPTG